jgi:hypothetical protein
VITPTNPPSPYPSETLCFRFTSKRPQVCNSIITISFHQPRVISGGERWYMNQIELSYSSSNPIFEHIDRPGLRVKLSTPPHTFLFPTPIGKSFECMQEKTVVMFAQVIANWSRSGE